MKELNCNEVVSQWGNFGDNNPIEHGTKFVKADTENDRCYHVIVVESLEWTQGEDGWFLSQCYVDLNDTWINWNDITKFSGIQRYDETEAEYKASALVEYYGTGEFNGEPLSTSFDLDFNGVANHLFSEVEVIALLNEYGIMLERSNEILKATMIQYNDSESTYMWKEDVESIGETVDGEGIICLGGFVKFTVSESLEQLQTMLEGYDVEVLTDDEEEDENE